MFKRPLITLLLSGACLSSAPLYAHHGSNGQFDTGKTISVEGVITDIKFVNPHGYVYFDVTPKNGGEVEAWRCELRAASAMKRAGWTVDTFETGARVKITGAPARREEHGCMMQTISFNGGPVLQRRQTLDSVSDAAPTPRQLVTSSGTPNLAGNWSPVQPQRGERRAPPGGDAMGRGEMGARPTGGGGRSRYGQTAAGRAASAGFTDDDNPRYHCQATNIFHDFWFDRHVNTITQEGDTIKITYGFMDIVRTIHLGMDSHPDNIVPSRAGHSIGTWEGNTLIVDTVGFAEGYLDPRGGTKHSDQLHTVERFTMSKDGKTLTQSYVGSDPKYLTDNFSGELSLEYTTDAFDPYNCEDLTEEIVSGF